MKEKKKALTIEAALRELEQITETLDDEAVDIAGGLQKFERGLELLRDIKGQLQQTELTIRELKAKYKDVFTEEG